MAEWLKTALIDIVELIGGGTPKTSKAEYWGGNINWLSVKDFNNENRYVYSTEKTITEEGLNNSSTKLLKKDDIIISARGTVGELAMIPFPMAFNQSCYGIRAKEGIDMLIAHRKAPFILGVAAGTVKHPQATFDYSFLVVKVDYICHGFHRSNREVLQLICY